MGQEEVELGVAKSGPEGEGEGSPVWPIWVWVDQEDHVYPADLSAWIRSDLDASHYGPLRRMMVVSPKFATVMDAARRLTRLYRNTDWSLLHPDEYALVAAVSEVDHERP